MPSEDENQANQNDHQKSYYTNKNPKSAPARWRISAAKKVSTARRATDAEILEDAERLIAALAHPPQRRLIYESRLQTDARDTRRRSLRR
jgi:hypothetical protein